MNAQIERQKEFIMAKMCPLDGCKSKKGMCIHDWMMLGMGATAIVLASAHWGLHAF